MLLVDSPIQTTRWHTVTLCTARFLRSILLALHFSLLSLQFTLSLWPLSLPSLSLLCYTTHTPIRIILAILL